MEGESEEHVHTHKHTARKQLGDLGLKSFKTSDSVLQRTIYTRRFKRKSDRIVNNLEESVKRVMQHFSSSVD